MGRTYCIVREDNYGSPRIYGVKHLSMLIDTGSIPIAPIFYFMFFVFCLSIARFCYPFALYLARSFLA